MRDPIQGEWYWLTDEDGIGHPAQAVKVGQAHFWFIPDTAPTVTLLPENWRCGPSIEDLIDRAGRLRKAQTILRAIIGADERGQGVRFSEAMGAAHEFLADDE
jgi:hypothetical protein